MPATPLAPATRFYHAGLTKVIFIPGALGNKAAPTRTEINSGTDLSGDIADWSGWAVRSNEIATPDLGSRFTSNIDGRTQADQSTLTLYADEGGDDVRTLLPRGTTGHVLIADGGDVPGNRADVFPVKVRGLPKERSVGDEAGRITVEFSITAEPAENVVLPA